jgi:hypothetical protein
LKGKTLVALGRRQQKKKKTAAAAAAAIELRACCGVGEHWVLGKSSEFFESLVLGPMRKKNCAETLFLTATRAFFLCVLIIFSSFSSQFTKLCLSSVIDDGIDEIFCHRDNMPVRGEAG